MKNWTKPEVSELEVSLTANGRWDACFECKYDDIFLDGPDKNDDNDNENKNEDEKTTAS